MASREVWLAAVTLLPLLRFGLTIAKLFALYFTRNGLTENRLIVQWDNVGVYNDSDVFNLGID